MKIRLLFDLPIESKHGMKKGRVLEVIGEKRAEPIGGGDQGRREMFYVKGDAGERCGVLPQECKEVRRKKDRKNEDDKRTT
jgi:hypothetical protein